MAGEGQSFDHESIGSSAPIPDLPAVATEWGGSTHARPLGARRATSGTCQKHPIVRRKVNMLSRCIRGDDPVAAARDYCQDIRLSFYKSRFTRALRADAEGIIPRPGLQTRASFEG